MKADRHRQVNEMTPGDSKLEERRSRPSLRDFEARLRRQEVRGTFSAAETAGLPEPVRRYFRSAIAPGTPIATAARLKMSGSIKIGRWLSFRAEEVLAPLQGFVWAARVARVITGADAMVDGHGGMHWKLLGLGPVVTAGGPDYEKSAAGRFGGEAMWIPTALLPRFGVEWKAESPMDVTASFSVDGSALELRYVLDEEGRVCSVAFDRWRGAEGSDPPGMYPFGGDVIDYRSFAGLTIPSEGRFGWFYGTDRWDEGEFFRYEVTDLRLLGSTCA